MNKQIRPRTAFSLIEVSVVILIIGVFVAGIAASNYLLKKATISSARTLTKSSPIAAIKGLSLWFETSTEESINSGEATDGAALTGWNDIGFSTSKPTITVGSVSPTYANTINRIPAVRFAGDLNGYFSFDGKFLVGSDYTVVVLEQRESNQANNYFLGNISSSTSNQNLLLGYNANGSIIHSQAGTTASDDTNSYSAAVPTYVAGSPKLFVFTNSASGGKKTYVNGMLVASSTNTDTISALPTLHIGKGYAGQIGELAIFNRALDAGEIADIAQYSAKKWNIKAAPSGSSCIGGAIDSGNNCNLITCTASGTGYNKTGLAYATGGSGTFTCDSGYSGTINYTCTASGAATITSGTCSPITCTASGTGYNKTGLAYATGGSGTFTCDSGYSGTLNYTCTASGAATITSGTCSPITCTASGTGYNKTGLAYATGGSGTFTCDSGYSGTINYTCTSVGAATITAGTCSSGATGNYFVQVNPFGSATSTSDAQFQAWFAANNCQNSPVGVGVNPGSYTFANGTITNTSSGWRLWMPNATTKYYKSSGWTAMATSTPSFGANIVALGCTQ
ncbi:MAG: prepilin-type N-terminal cleavage/methylation domain-containing protein [Rickettsiales bacterium]|nr:prepilin-type N-terminal cleavage/methylation domain-containing protein [Rickettsiales bacterium]